MGSVGLARVREHAREVECVEAGHRASQRRSLRRCHATSGQAAVDLDPHIEHHSDRSSCAGQTHGSVNAVHRQGQARTGCQEQGALELWGAHEFKGKQDGRVHPGVDQRLGLIQLCHCHP